MYEALYGYPPFVSSSVSPLSRSFAILAMFSLRTTANDLSGTSPGRRCMFTPCLHVPVNRPGRREDGTLMNSLNWRTTLKFPPTPRLTSGCTDLLVSLLCEPEDRLGSSLSSQSGTGRGSRNVLTIGKGGLGRGGEDGAEEIKRHPWFEGVDWNSRSIPFNRDK